MRVAGSIEDTNYRVECSRTQKVCPLRPTTCDGSGNKRVLSAWFVYFNPGKTRRALSENLPDVQTRLKKRAAAIKLEDGCIITCPCKTRVGKDREFGGKEEEVDQAEIATPKYRHAYFRVCQCQPRSEQALEHGAAKGRVRATFFWFEGEEVLPAEGEGHRISENVLPVIGQRFLVEDSPASRRGFKAVSPAMKRSSHTAIRRRRPAHVRIHIGGPGRSVEAKQQGNEKRLSNELRCYSLTGSPCTTIVWILDQVEDDFGGRGRQAVATMRSERAASADGQQKAPSF